MSHARIGFSNVLKMGGHVANLNEKIPHEHFESIRNSIALYMIGFVGYILLHSQNVEVIVRV